MFSKSKAINILSLARLFLFGARDVWFVIALPVYLAANLGWDYWFVGGFLASWVIGYGVVQAFAPRLTGIVEGKAAGWEKCFHLGRCAFCCTGVDCIVDDSGHGACASAAERASCFRRSVCREFVPAQLPYCELCRQRWGVDGCGFLLYGERHG